MITINWDRFYTSTTSKLKASTEIQSTQITTAFLFTEFQNLNPWLLQTIRRSRSFMAENYLRTDRENWRRSTNRESRGRARARPGDKARKSCRFSSSHSSLWPLPALSSAPPPFRHPENLIKTPHAYIILLSREHSNYVKQAEHTQKRTLVSVVELWEEWCRLREESSMADLAHRIAASNLMFRDWFSPPMSLLISTSSIDVKSFVAISVSLFLVCGFC